MPSSVRVVPKDGDAFMLSQPELTADSVIGVGKDSARIAFPADQVKRFETNGVSTLTLVLVPIGLAAGIAWGLSDAKKN